MAALNVIPDVILNEDFKNQIVKIQMGALLVKNLFLLKSCSDFENIHRSLVRNYEDGKIDDVEFVKRMTLVVKDYSFLIVRFIDLTEQSQVHSKKWLKKSFIFHKNPLQLLFHIVSACGGVKLVYNAIAASKEGVFANMDYLENGLIEVVRLDQDDFQANLKFLEVFFTIFTQNKTFTEDPMSVLNTSNLVMSYVNSPGSCDGEGAKI